MRALLLIATLLAACSSATRQPGELRGRGTTVTQDELAATNSGLILAMASYRFPEFVAASSSCVTVVPRPRSSPGCRVALEHAASSVAIRSNAFMGAAAAAAAGDQSRG